MHKHKCVCTVRRESARQHRSASRTDTEICTVRREVSGVERSKEAKCSSWSVRELNVRAHNLSKSQWEDGTPAGLQTRSAPGQDTRSEQGALARRHTDGPLRAALLKTTAMCKAWRLMHYARLPSDPSRTLLQQLISFSHYNSVLDTDTGTGPIPSITVSRVNAYSGGVLARALPEGLRYLST